MSKKAAHAVVVVSNAKDSRNNSNHFYNVLKSPLDLSHGHWLVGVKKIIYHNAMMTIVNESVTCKIKGGYTSKSHTMNVQTEWIKVDNLELWYRVIWSRSVWYAVEIWVGEPLEMLTVNIFVQPSYSSSPLVGELFYNVKDLPFKKLFTGFSYVVKTFSIQFVWITGGKTYRIAPGHYDTLGEVCEAINAAVQTAGLKFQEESSGRCKIVIDQEVVKSVSLNNDLNLTLGFDQREFTTSAQATHDPQLDRGRFAMFLYSNIVEYSLVGDAQAPLLDVISLPRQKFGDIVTVDVAQPTYRPVAIKQLREIEILCASDSGEAMPFAQSNSKTLVELHFINTRI